MPFVMGICLKMKWLLFDHQKVVPYHNQTLYGDSKRPFMVLFVHPSTGSTTSPPSLKALAYKTLQIVHACSQVH